MDFSLHSLFSLFYQCLKKATYIRRGCGLFACFCFWTFCSGFILIQAERHGYHSFGCRTDSKITALPILKDHEAEKTGQKEESWAITTKGPFHSLYPFQHAHHLRKSTITWRAGVQNHKPMENISPSSHQDSLHRCYILEFTSVLLLLSVFTIVRELASRF